MLPCSFEIPARLCISKYLLIKLMYHLCFRADIINTKCALWNIVILNTLFQIKMIREHRFFFSYDTNTGKSESE